MIHAAVHPTGAVGTCIGGILAVETPEFAECDYEAGTLLLEHEIGRNALAVTKHCDTIWRVHAMFRLWKAEELLGFRHAHLVLLGALYGCAWGQTCGIVDASLRHLCIEWFLRIERLLRLSLIHI